MSLQLIHRTEISVEKINHSPIAISMYPRQSVYLTPLMEHQCGKIMFPSQAREGGAAYPLPPTCIYHCTVPLQLTSLIIVITGINQEHQKWHIHQNLRPPHSSVSHGKGRYDSHTKNKVLSFHLTICLLKLEDVGKLFQYLVKLSTN